MGPEDTCRPWSFWSWSSWAPEPEGVSGPWKDAPTPRKAFRRCFWGRCSPGRRALGSQETPSPCPSLSVGRWLLLGPEPA